MDACFPCFSSKRHGVEDREPLLPKHQRPLRQTPELNEPPPDEPLSKLANILAALSVGKLPSQTQINNLLRRILHSNVLQESQNAQSRTTPEILRGSGPLSRRGRKVIQDVVHVIEALLQFGMEKNDDDLLQDLFSQLSQISSDESPVSFEAKGDSGEASARMHQLREQAGKIKEVIQEHVPHQSEVSQDTKTLAKELSSLLKTFLTSSVFRLILADAVSIGREWVAHTASDISNAALHIHDIAEGVEHKAKADEFGRGAGMPSGDISLKEMTNSLIEEGKAAVSDTVQDVQESVKEKKEKWGGHVVETEEEVKRRLLTRIQEMMTRAQEDPSSRHAIITILQVIRKYAHKLTLASQEATENVQDAVAGPSSGPKKPHSEGSGPGIPTGFADPTSYPPQPYSPLLPGSLSLEIEIDSPHLQHVLRNSRTMLERIAQGHKIDDMMQTLGDIFRHSITAPTNFGKNVGKLAQDKLHYDGDETSSVGTTKHTEHHHHGAGRWTDEPPPSAGPSVDSEHDHHFEGANLFSMYFSSVGQYLDRALTRPGWANSNSGRKSLETLYEATRELLRIGGEAVADTENIVKEGAERVKDLGQAEQELEEMGDEMRSAREGGREEVEEKAKCDVHKVADQWIQDIIKFLKQAGNYIDALERDRTTMKLVHALEQLREDAQDLFGAGKEIAAKAASKSRTKFQPRARDSGTGKLSLYTQWLGWALPRLLHLLPLGSIPVPRVEIQTDDIECAIDARWIQGFVLHDGQVNGQYGAVNDREGTASGALWQDEAVSRESTVRCYGKGGIGGKLVPDEILVRQWTEVRVSLAEGLGAAAVGADDARYRLGLAGELRGEHVPGIEATSRMRMCMGGIKACVRGMGYYFKYTGSLVQYEDEGVASIDLGMVAGVGQHSGFSLDIELEMDKGDVDMDLYTANTATGIPILIVEDVDNDSESDFLDPDIPQNFDVQEVIYEAGHHPSRQPSPNRHSGGRNYGRRSLEIDRAGPSKPSIDLALANIIPLFRVLNVQADLRGVRLKINQSRHWVLNKLIVEPFAGPLIKSTVRQVLEERVRRALEAMASGMALIMMEAKERAARRRVKQSVLREKDEYEKEEEGQMKFGDLYAALVERGPEIFRYYTGSDTDAGSSSYSTETHTELTNRGIMFSKQAHMHINHQPDISPAMMIPPPGSMNDEGSSRGQELEYGRKLAENSESSGEEGTHEVRLAIGIGAQLFPGKAGPSGGPKDTRGAGKAVLKEVRDNIEEVRESVEEEYGRVKGGLQQEYERGKGRFMERRERERERVDWRSSAFDL